MFQKSYVLKEIIPIWKAVCSLSNARYNIFGCQNMPHFKFRINIMCLYKSTKPRWSLFPVWDISGCDKKAFKVFHKEVVHMSALILSKELSIFVRVFLMRNAVSLADGFWYQHSFMSLTIDVKVWKIKTKQETESGEGRVKNTKQWSFC